MVMLIPSPGVKDKDAVSSLAPALLTVTVSSALVLLDLALPLVVVVVLATLIADLITASGFTLVTAMIAIILTLTLMLDFPAFNLLEDLLVPSVSLVLLILRALAPKPLSALSMIVAVLEAVLDSPLMSVVSLLSALRRAVSLFLVMLVSLTALTQLSTARLLVKRLVLEDVWVEVIVAMVLAFVIKASRVRTVPKELN